MQRHKKWLIITIWISTIAFIGAGFVGWGQYSYGNKAGAVAKVGDIEISQGELQKAYSRLYNQYNQVFKGNFDEEKAKQFGLQKQALQTLLQQALVLNLAHAYDLTVSNKEIVKVLQSQKAFQKDGIFNAEVYKQVLSQNRLTPTEYEKELKKELLIEKTLKLLPVKVSKNEKNILESMFKIADKLNYKLLALKDMKVDIDEQKLKEFWQAHKNDFKTDVLYSVTYIKVAPIHKTYSDKEIKEYYQNNKMHFRDKDGKILPLLAAKEKIVQELDAKTTKDQSLRTYIAFKKNRLDKTVELKRTNLSQSQNPFNETALKTIAKHTVNAPFIKPLLIAGNYYIFRLDKVTPAQVKTFQQAKASLLPIYIQEARKAKIIQTAKKSLDNFTGLTTDFVTVNATDKLTALSKTEANDFLQKLFVSQKKKDFIILSDGNLVLYNILEQKMLPNTNIKLNDEMKKLKSAIFNEGLIKKLQKMYQTEIFIKGL
jgi:peptidyl-prolyl cis-trans isomerase D